MLILPLRVHVVVYLLVGDGEHDDEDPEQHHADHELVEDPHGHHGGVDRVGAHLADQDAAAHVVSRHTGQVPQHHARDPGHQHHHSSTTGYFSDSSYYAIATKEGGRALFIFL